MFGNKNIRAAKKAVKRLDVAAFNTALAAIPDSEKPEILGDALLRVIGNGPEDKTEAFVANLLKPGAKINPPGIVLARAIEANQTTPVIKLLHDSGESFDDAFTLMLNNGWGQNSIEKLKNQREIITGSREKIVPPPEESEEAKFRAQVLMRLDSLAAQFNDISQRLARLEAAAGIDPAGQPAAPTEAARSIRTTPITL